MSKTKQSTFKESRLKEFSKKWDNKQKYGGFVVDGSNIISHWEIKQFISETIDMAEREHTDNNLVKSYIKLSDNEKKLLCIKGSLVGTDAKKPKEGLIKYVEKLINEYISIGL